MRVLRAKQVRKHLRLYRIIYGVEAPFHVLLDGNFIFTALKYKVDVRDRMEKLLQDTNVKLYVLRSVLIELEKTGDKAKPALQFAQSYCETIEDSSTKGETVIDKVLGLVGTQGHAESKISKSRKYCVATQDKEIRAVLGSKNGVPLIYLNNVTMILEPPSNYSKEANVEIEAAKMKLSEEESVIVKTLQKGKKRKQGDISATNISLLKDGAGVVEDLSGKERVKRKAKSPNPLSTQQASKDSKTSKRKKQSKFKS